MSEPLTFLVLFCCDFLYSFHFGDLLIPESNSEKAPKTRKATPMMKEAIAIVSTMFHPDLKNSFKTFIRLAFSKSLSNS